MIQMQSTSWAAFKSVAITKKNLLLQYSESSGAYDIYGCDSMFIWQYTLLKNGDADVTDFETNYKAKANAKIGSDESQPYSVPSFRTKRNATPTVETCEANNIKKISFQLTEELYTKGGCLLANGAQFGDYISAAVEDTDGVIPAPYRAALCENWPIVATYILKEFVQVDSSGFVIHEVDTKPLVAKLSPGLYLTLTYHAISTGSTRNFAVNYYLKKKL